MGCMSKAQFTCAVVPQYLEDQSNPVRHEYAFAYTVTIVNSGDVPAQLIRAAPSDPLITVSLSDDPKVTAEGRVREVAPQANPPF